jgi:anti-sigma-K factor RskA
MNETSPPPAATTGVSGWWRAAAIALLVLMSIAVASTMSMFEQFKAQVAHLQQQIKEVPQVKYVSVLTDSKQAPGLLVTLVAQQRKLELQRLSNLTEGQNDSMQLWALVNGKAPRALGVLDARRKTIQLEVDEQVFQDVGELAISVEDRGGVPESQGPRLPYLFRGAWVQKAL